MPIKVGDKAPDFTLFNQDGEAVTLSSFKGKNVVVLFFFLMIRRPPRSTQSRSSAASDVYKRQV